MSPTGSFFIVFSASENVFHHFFIQTTLPFEHDRNAASDKAQHDKAPSVLQKMPRRALFHAQTEPI